MGHIVGFPEPFPDEDFRSIVFRYHVRSPNVEFYESRFELFGVRSYKQTMFPKRLKYLFDNLPVGHTFTIDQFLYEHTWYGLYKAFFTPDRNKQMLYNITEDSSLKRNPKGQPAIHAQSILASEIKYCPLCMEADDKRFGEADARLNSRHRLN
jgi:hypothetical protein